MKDTEIPAETRTERAIIRNAFRRMNAAEKLDYIWTYYKPLVIFIILLIYIISYAVYRRISKKEAVLYAACVNIAIGSDTEDILSNQFISFTGGNSKKSQVYIYHDLYLTDDADLASHEYAYASRMKLLAAANASRLDIAIMNREGYNLLSESGYLLDLSECLEQYAPELLEDLQPLLTDNTVILTDNALEYHLNTADEYQAVTERRTNGMEISRLPVFQNAGFSDAVYLGVFPNSPRLDSVIQYIAYLTGES